MISAANEAGDRNNPTNAVQIRLRASLIGQKDCVILPQLSARLGLRQGQPDQYAQLRVDLRSPSLWARLPTPVAKPALCQRTSVSGRVIVRTFRIDGNQRYIWTKNQRSLLVSCARPLTLRRKTIS